MKFIFPVEPIDILAIKALLDISQESAIYRVGFLDFIFTFFLDHGRNMITGKM